MKKFKKKLNIESAQSFKIEYSNGEEIKSKNFNSLKALEQFNDRQTDFMYLDLNRYALINGKWHLFIKLKSPIVFKEDLNFINKTFIAIEEKNLQFLKNEEKKHQ